MYTSMKKKSGLILTPSQQREREAFHQSRRTQYFDRSSPCMYVVFAIENQPVVATLVHRLHRSYNGWSSLNMLVHNKLTEIKWTGLTLPCTLFRANRVV